MLNKICVRLVGGLGNQLFIYAFGLARAKKQGKELLIDNVSGFGSRDIYHSVFALDGFKIKDKFIKNRFYSHVIANRYFWWFARKLKLCHVERDTTSYNVEIDDVDSIFFQGYWQSYLYFHEYKNIIKSNLKLLDTQNSKILGYKNHILNSENSVAIGMRFYEAFPGDAEKYGVYTEDYYVKAMELIESKEKNLTYFVFSMNIDRAKKELSKYHDRNIVFVNPLVSMADAKLDMYLMSLCNHYIISNSTMYWWAAYLGETDSSVVVTPYEGLDNNDALLPHWIKLK